jgi:hypothetical protein
VICCIIAACFILRYLVQWGDVAKYFGFKDIYGDKDPYGFTEYCELDQYED